MGECSGIGAVGTGQCYKGQGPGEPSIQPNDQQPNNQRAAAPNIGTERTTDRSNDQNSHAVGQHAVVQDVVTPRQDVLLTVPETPVPGLHPATGVSRVNESKDARDILLVASSVSGTIDVVDVGRGQSLGWINAVPDLQERLDAMSLTEEILYRTIEHAQKNEHGERSDGMRLVDDLSMSPDGRYIYISRSNLGDVIALDMARTTDPTSPHIAWRSPIEGGKADHAAMSPDGKYYAVSASIANKVIVYDTRNGGVAGSFETGALPHQVDFVQIDGELHIVNASLGHFYDDDGLPDEKAVLTIAKADPPFNVIAQHEFPAGIRPAVFVSEDGLPHEDARYMYYQLSNFSGVKKFDLRTGDFLENEDVHTVDRDDLKFKDLPHASRTHGLSISKDGEHLCVAGTITDTVTIVSPDDSEIPKVVESPDADRPTDNDAIPYWSTDAGGQCHVSLAGADALQVVDYATGSSSIVPVYGTFPQRSREARLPASVVEGLARKLSREEPPDLLPINEPGPFMSGLSRTAYGARKAYRAVRKALDD